MTSSHTLDPVPDVPSWADAGAWLSHWSEATGSTTRLVNLSENATHITTGPVGRFALRVHRPGYQTVASIESELAWLTALRRDTNLTLPEPIPGADGRLVQTLEAGCHAVLFAHLPGREPEVAGDLGGLFAELGKAAAILHRHARAFAPPSGFSRQVWSAATMLDPDGLWGDWRAAPGAEAVRPVLDRLDEALRRDLEAYGTAPERFGLIHADMRLANLLVDGERLAIIDFDDMGYCWFMYDFAAAISFHEDDPRVGEWRRRWIDGYRTIAPLADGEIAALDAMVMLRRMVLLAWIGTHLDAPLARALAPRFAEGTSALGQTYLDRRGLAGGSER